MQAKTVVGVIALALALLGGATALATTQTTSPDATTLTAPAADPSSRGVNTTANGEMPAGYPGVKDVAAFRRARQSDDAVPDALAEAPLLNDGVGDFRRARRAQVSGTQSVWLMPGRKDSICIVSQAALNCAPAGVVEQDGVAPSIFKTADGPFKVMGIAADDVRSLEVALDTGETLTIAIVENVFVIESDAQPRTLRWLHAGKNRSFEFPSDMFELPAPG